MAPSQSSLPSWSRYALALAIAGATVLATALFAQLGGVTFLVSLVAVGIVGLWLGTGPALAATAAAGLAIAFFLLEPQRGPALATAFDRVRIVLFLIVGGMVSAIAGSRRASRLQLISARDEARRATDRAEAALAALRETDRRKDEFLAVLSHELRNPLAPIRNSVGVLERAPAGSAASRRAGEVIARQVDHLVRLVDDLLDVTRIARGKIRLQRHRLELGALVRRVALDHRAAFDEREERLQIDVPEAPVWVDGDDARLAQVIGNLLQNAAKFTGPGGNVRLALEHVDGRASIVVRDDGPGLEPELLGRLFVPFAQADRTLARSAGGLGLGLSLVKGIAELHGGDVAARSDGPGHGAEFTVRLPVAPPPPDAIRVVPEVVPAPPPRHRRVLVIEDSADAAESLKDVLELDGHEVEVAHDGPEGLAVARRTHPDVVLCDLGLPDMDGFAVARAFRADPVLRRTGLIALTGYAAPEDRRRAIEAGFDEHLAKPPDLERLARLIGETTPAPAPA